MALPNKTFWVNYNARNYDTTNHKIPKESGQLYDADLVLPGSVSLSDDHIVITDNKRVDISFGSTSANIFNRTTSNASMTFIAKAKGTRNQWFVSNRQYSNVGWMVNHYPSNYQMAYTGDSNKYSSNTEPMIMAWRMGTNGQQYIAISDNVTGTPYQTTDWVGQETDTMHFFGGGDGSEYWTGDFYWLYISPETLTDAEIQQVITYNDHLHEFSCDKQSLRFEASGGTNTLEITAETGWTCTTPTAFTMSTTTGGTGTTSITVTAPANTGSTKIEETITFTDDDNYTFDVKLRQKVEGAGYSYLQIGEDTIDTFYIGDLQIEALYMGEEQIYGSGPFVGLRATTSLSFTPNKFIGTLRIKSTENWSLTDNSTVGSYYTLENYTNGCDGWVPTYDGSLDGGELGEYGLWFEWKYGVSTGTFQEYLDNLASHGITATGSYCPGARYSIYLNPHQTGGPGWLSYSQTTGGTGETIVTVTANTYSMSEAKTATITISSANYTATTNVNLNFYIMPANEVWYKTTNNNSINSFRSGSYYIGSNGQQLTYTQSFDSESGLWKMVFNDDVYGNYESLYYNNDNRLVELWLPRYFNRPNGIFIYGQTHFEKFKGDSPSIVDNGNMVIDLVQSSQTYNWAVQGAKANVTDIVVPNGVTTIQGYCFYCTTASTLTIPASVTIVEVYSLERTVINRIDCLGTTAPTFYSQTFYAVSNNGTLHYPAGADYSSVYVPSTWTKVGDL